MKEQVHIGIAEDHELVRQGLVALLGDNKSLKILFETGNGKELVDKLKAHKPHVILLDIEMPVLSGREALEIIRQRYPKVKIIILSAHYQKPVIIEYIKMGANAFLPKNCKIDKLVEAIHTVHKEGAYFDNQVSMMLASEVAGPAYGSENKIDLSETELSIIRQICQNKTNREIAEKLALSPRTVEWHRSRIMRKINSRNVSALILYAVENKLIHVA